MLISINTMRFGETDFQTCRRKTGNMAAATQGGWQVLIKEVDLDRQKVLASWSGNRPRTYKARNGSMPRRGTDPTKNEAKLVAEAAV